MPVRTTDCTAKAITHRLTKIRNTARTDTAGANEVKTPSSSKGKKTDGGIVVTPSFTPVNASIYDDEETTPSRPKRSTGKRSTRKRSYASMNDDYDGYDDDREKRR